jgi:predicted permease
MEQAQAQVDVISAQLTEAYPESHQGKGLLLTPLDEALVEDYRPSLLVLMGATGLLLLIACGNVAGLLVARITVRKVELSVRSALGASRARLLRQLFAESILMAALAGCFGAVLALWLQRVILTLMPIEQLGIQEVGLSGPMLAFAVLISLGTALVFGTGPALAASRADPAADLKSGTRSSHGGSAGRMRGGLVVLQVALSMVLLIGSGLLLRSFVRLVAVDVGFRTENLLTARVQISSVAYGDRDSRSQFFNGLFDDIRAMPGVESVSAINKLPIASPWMNWYAWDPGNPPETSDDRVSSFARWVLPGYFETMGVPVLQGRDHQDRDHEYPLPLLVINESMAEALFPGQDPIGRQLSIFNAINDPFTVEVLGVVSDFRVTSLDQAPLPQMYFSHNTMPDISMSLVVRASGDLASLVGPIRLALQERDSDVPLANVATMRDILGDSISTNRVISVAMAAFAALALFLAMTGLYGVLAYYVARRTHEIGIRMAFGADPARIMLSVLRRGMALVGAGLVVGCLGALGASRLLQWQLYQMTATDPVTYGAVTACFVAVGILACLLPARRATRIDPVEAFEVE